MPISEIVDKIEEEIKGQIDNLTHIPKEKRNDIIEKLNDILDDLDELSETYGDDPEESDDSEENDYED